MNSFSLSHDSKTSSQFAFTWLLTLRWGAIIGQCLIIFTVFLLFDIDLPVGIIAVIIAFGVLTNFLFSFLMKRRASVAPPLFAYVMALDVMLLTALLHYTGGPMNPFTFIYLVHIALGAILMRPKWAWSLAAFTAACYAFIFFLPAPGSCGHFSLDHLPMFLGGEPSLEAPESHLSMHLQGMWFAFVITAAFIVHYMGRIQNALARHQEVTARLKEEKARSERLASLATLAAGAAHEFSTPLSTIAVAAGEMAHMCKDDPSRRELYDDARLIRRQVDSCKEILFQMTADAGEHLGEALKRVRLDQLASDIVKAFHAEAHGDVSIRNEAGDLPLRIPVRMFIRTLKGILKNAGEASPGESSIELTIRPEREMLAFIVKDWGCGMSGDVLAKATEPFFTTKEPGKGLGLGLFLARTMAERFGGSLEIDTDPGKGTTVSLQVALSLVMASESN